MKEADFYNVRKHKVETVETIHCKSFLPEKKANFINSLLFPGATLRCGRNCYGIRTEWGECNGYFYQCKRCGATFGDVTTALECPMCKKKQKQKTSADNPIGREDKCD